MNKALILLALIVVSCTLAFAAPIELTADNFKEQTSSGNWFIKL